MPDSVAREFETITTKHFSTGALNRFTLTSLMGMSETPFQWDGVITLVPNGDDHQGAAYAPTVDNAMQLAKELYLSAVDQSDHEGEVIGQHRDKTFDINKMEAVVFYLVAYQKRFHEPGHDVP